MWGWLDCRGPRRASGMDSRDDLILLAGQEQNRYFRDVGYYRVAGPDLVA